MTTRPTPSEETGAAEAVPESVGQPEGDAPSAPVEANLPGGTGLRKTQILCSLMALAGAWCVGAFYSSLRGAHFSDQHSLVFWVVFALLTISVGGLLFTFARQGFARIAATFAARTDSEHQQAMLRQVLASLVLAATALATAMGASGAGLYWAIFIMSAGMCMSTILLLSILWQPQASPVRRLVAAAADTQMMCLIMYVGGEGTSILYPLVMFVVFGYGFRFGLKYLLAAALLATIGFAGMVIMTPFWQSIPAVAYSLLAGLIVLPAYAATLITALTRATAEAEAANQAKSRFLATISHELRTPLTAVIGLSGLIKNTELDSDQRGMVRSIRSSARALLSLINNILDFSKYEAGNIALSAVKFDLYALLAEIDSMFAVQARAKGVRFQIHLAGNVPAGLVGDADHLRDILINLIGNAMKFTETGHIAVRVGANSEGDLTKLAIDVTDTGIGIPQSQQGRIFEQFSQADETTNRRYGGTGLGLAIVRHLVQAMGGTLGLTSEEGRGSTFHVKLPFDRHDEVTTTASRQAGQQVFVVSAREDVSGVLCPAIEDREERPMVMDSAAKFLALVKSGALPRRPVVLFDERQSDLGPLQFARLALGQNDRVSPVLVRITDGRPAVAGGDADGDADVDVYYAARLDVPFEQRLADHVLHFADFLGGGVSVDGDSQERASVQPMTVLLAEDNPVNQKVLGKILESAGHDITIVGTGDDALEALGEGGFDIALMDMNMPGMGGAEAVKLYRFETLGEPRLPIIALTADATAESRQDASDAGMDGYLTKPIEPEELLDAIEKYCAPESTEPAPVVVVDDPESLPALPEEPEIAAHPRRESALPPIIDRSAIENLRALGGQDFYDDLVAEFLTDSVRIIDRVGVAVQAADAKEVRDAAHAMRSAASHFGARRLHRLCMSVSKITEDEVREKGDAFLEELTSELDLVSREIKDGPSVATAVAGLRA